MTVKVALAVISCPACGRMLYYTQSGTIEIYDAKCMSCHKTWQIIEYGDGREEIREKTIN